MRKQSEVRSRIKKLMAGLGIENQARFAKKLGFKPTTLNAWMTGTSLPSPDAFATLARNAQDVDDVLFFLEQAGLTREAVISAAAKVSEAWRPLMGKTVVIGRFHETAEGMQEDGAPVAISGSYVSNPLSTIWLVVDEKLACDPFRPGDIIKLERDSGDASEARFYNHIVLAEFPVARAGQRLFALEGRSIGTLVLSKGFATDVPMLEFVPLKGGSGAKAVIGFVFSPTATSGKGGEARAAGITRENAELRRVDVIGRVTGWLAAAPHPENEHGE